MKIKSWHLIILAIIVFLLDFFTLGNRQVVDNKLANQIAAVIALLCLLVFLFGIIKTLYNLFSKNREAEIIKREQEEEQGTRATGLEIGLRRLLAILLIIIILPMGVLLPFYGLFLGLPNFLLALYLLLNRRYHLVFNCFLVVIGCLFYFFTFPLNQSYFSLYKSIELSACPGLINPITVFMNTAGPLAITKYFFLFGSLFLFAGDIIARLKLARKRRCNVAALLIICILLFFLPFLYVPQVALGQGTSDSVGSSSGLAPSHFLTNNTSYHMSYDQTSKSYIFTANIVNQDRNSSASITNICVDGKILPITIENNTLQVDNGAIAGGEISVAPGQTAIINLISQKPFYVFTLFEGLYHYSTSFLR